MKRKNGFVVVIGVVLSLFIVHHIVYAQPTSSETAGGALQRKVEQEKVKEFEQRLKKQELKETEEVVEEAELEAGPNVLINEIVVENVTLLSDDVIKNLIMTYEGQKLSMTKIQAIADEITAEYRTQGYVTSRAYVPPQSLQNGRLIIKVIEGKLGSLTVEGNKYFKTSLFREYIDLKPYGYFDYSALQRSLVYINEHPDRTARIVLVPGKEPGTTDLVLDVKDQFPFHVGFEYDNYASRFLKNDRFAWTLEHNNLLGFDDRLYLKGQYSEGALLELYQGRYVFPVNKTFDVGFYVLNVETDLVKEFEALDAHGDAFLAGIFINKEVIYRDDLELRLNAGFDYKDIKNHLLGLETSHDELRVIKFGGDLDFNDRFGRNIFTTELGVGIPDFLGSMDAKDPLASRAGAGGKFQKWGFHFFRLHPMPYESYILWKNSAQVSNHNLVASEQFQIGGPTSVRAYAPAEHSGDKGYYTAFEWSFPFYGLSRDVKVPFREEKLYDVLKWVIFYDFGYAGTNTPLAGEEKSETLKGYGAGVRVNIKDDLALRVEAGFPQGKKSEDGDRAHVWFEFQLKF